MVRWEKLKVYKLVGVFIIFYDMEWVVFVCIELKSVSDYGYGWYFLLVWTKYFM